MAVEGPAEREEVVSEEGIDVIAGAYWISSSYEREAGRYNVCAWKRLQKGIKQLVYLYDAYDEARIRRDVGALGDFSRRPFTLGRRCDGTTDACCHALYVDFCRRHGLDPYELHRRAYQEQRGDGYRRPNYDLEARAAAWQGVVYPALWGEREIRGLLRSLYAINNRSLVAVLEETPPYLALGPLVTARWAADY